MVKQIKIRRWFWFILGFLLAFILSWIFILLAFANYAEQNLNKVHIEGEWFVELVRDFDWDKYNTKISYYPQSCFRDYDSFLNQFPNKTVPEIVNFYQIYCGKIKKEAGK